MSKQLISFVLPIYNEEGNIDLLWQQMLGLQTQLNQYNCEFIFVNDGSSDSSLPMLVNLYEQHTDCIKVVNFSRNHGHQIAVTAGQDIAQGDAIIIMDTDLQDPPETCLDLVAKWQEGTDIVYAQRNHYKTNFVKEKSAWLFYRILKSIASVDIPVDTGDFRLISKRVNDEMKKYPEKARYLRGISSLVGYKQDCVKFNRKDRLNGNTGYTFVKSLKLAIDGITGFSVFPLQLISIMGTLFALFGFAFGTVYIVFSLFSGRHADGWASIMFMMLFMGGIQMVMLGLIGEYLGRVYVQVLDRPLYTVDKIWRSD